MTFFAGLRTLCADIRKPRFFRFGLRATPFLGDKKGGKELSGGDAP